MAIRSTPGRGPHRRRLAIACLTLAGTTASAQEAAQSVTITGRSGGNAASVAGFGDQPISRSPLSASVITTTQLADAGIGSLADITRLDAALTDAYNAPGYWGILAARGFTLDNRFNYRRDGLPINAETTLPQANKQALELLKGTSGIQAGTSAPGGLVNLVVKRPKGRVREVTLGWAEDQTRVVSLDVAERSGAIGWRVNAEYAHLQPPTFDSRGHRELAAIALDAEPAPGTLVEFEFEASEQTQPSTPGLSLLGGRLPDADAIDPRTNLNRQPWRLPVVMGGRTGSLRLTQALGADWQFTAHAMRQRLTTDDRIAFPFGCSAEGRFDRYCSDGSFDVYDYRSEGERRTSDALDLAVSGRAQLLGMEHQAGAGLLFTRYQGRFNRLAYNWVGVGTLDGLTVLPADPTLAYEQTNRDERSTELHLQDRVVLATGWALWAGLRSTRLDRRSVATDGSAATATTQSFTTPWLAISRGLGPQGLVYASWGQGVESDVAPNLPIYANAGRPLPSMKSRQFEAGIKQRGDSLDWAVAAFDIDRPLSSDLGSCDADASCTRGIDGSARHRGVEGEAEWRAGAWNLRGSAMLLRARREDAADPADNGLRPTNVPATSLKAQVAYNVAALPGLALLGFVIHEGDRMVLPDNLIATPGWTRVDLAARYTQRLPTGTLIWRVGVDNVADTRAWKEAPYQFAHAYLYPLPPRSWHLSAQLSL